MSNQFYKYIAEELVRYWEETKVRKGERFYLQLDEVKEVEMLVEELINFQQSKPFKYQHEKGEPYETFFLDVGDTKVVVAYANEQVKTDYLALIRNEVSEQKNEWQGTALISIVAEQLDTIPGGSINVEKEGMPLHPNSLFLKLKEDIKKSKLSKVEQIILEDNLDNLLKEQFHTRLTFFEFEDVFITLSKGEIEPNEYSKFGLFQDSELATYTGSNLKKRLQENRDFFESVKEVHDYGLGEDKLQNKFSVNGSSELIKEDWKEIPFSKVHKFRDDYLRDNKAIKVQIESVKEISNVKVWDRTVGETAAALRKRHIIVFNPNKESDVEIQAHFNLEGPVRSLSKEFLTVHKNFVRDVISTVKVSNIAIKLNVDPNVTTFAKVSYKHDKKAALGAELLIAVVPMEPYLFEPHKTSYLINPLTKQIEVLMQNGQIVLGEGLIEHKIVVNQNNETIVAESQEKYVIQAEEEIWDEEGNLSLVISTNNSTIPLVVANKLPEKMPITGMRIWKLIREEQSDMQWIRDTKRLTMGTREYFMNSDYVNFFLWEDEWVQTGMRHGKIDSGALEPLEINLPEDLREAYSRFINYFKARNAISSISYASEDYRQRANEYIDTYTRTIESFPSGSPIGSKGMDVFKLGTISANETLYYTPYHPLMVSYKLKFFELIQNEELDNVLLGRLSPEGLIPHIYFNEDLYKPEHQDVVKEWLVFKPVKFVTVSDASQYLGNVVYDKINQFKEHFTYLFVENSKAPLQVNVINISNDHQVLVGIVKWMMHEIETKGIDHVFPVEITLYTDESEESIFHKFAKIETHQQLQELINKPLKLKDYDEETVLRAIRENLFYFMRPCITKDRNLRYAHITFYKMHAQEQHATQPMQQMKADLALDGIMSSAASMRDKENYKSGFGIKNYSIENDSYLVKTAYYANELAANTRNGGNDTYMKGNAILSRTTTADELTLNAIFDQSHWVTFVDPNVDLEFFNNYDTDLIVIHYSDQYSSSSRYDAITVTNKSLQYEAVIKEFLAGKDIAGTKDNVNKTIEAFNTFNGEWLLRIIGSKGHFDREKLSIISAIKYSLAYFDHPSIKWVPISLEELLRVAGVFNLTKKDGIFSAKNLGVKGSHSDDLLLIGLEEVEEQLTLHFYPVEVKIGYNNPDVLSKAKAQVHATKKLIINELASKDKPVFKQKFYKNFFVHLLLANANKMVQGGIWKEKGYNLSDETIERLLKLQFEISDHLSEHIGKGAVISFQKEVTHRSSYLEDDVQIVKFTMEDGYIGLVRSMPDAIQWLQHGTTDFIKERLFSRKYGTVDLEHKKQATILQPLDIGNDNSIGLNQSKDSLLINGVNNEIVISEEKRNDNFSEIQIEKINPTNLDDINLKFELIEDAEAINNVVVQKVDITSTRPVIEPAKELEEDLPILEKEIEITPSNEIDIKDVRIKIGTAQNSNKEIYWEYGHSGLANRHLLILGKSGQGKTYFMQCLLLEKARQGVSSIVIDYTEGFLPNQLEPEFQECLGDRIKHQIVFHDKLPINPFTRNTRDIGGIQLPESNTDIAERIKSVFSAVYSSLGIQQLNAIYEAILRGLERYDQNMNLMYLKELLEEENSNTSKTALSQIRPLIDRNPFKQGETIDWAAIRDRKGEIYIVQLTGFPRDVQLIITEFLLWDLWNFSVREGNKNSPLPVIMDEAQNLDHTEESPSARILTEGRKFGWSAWYATQFLKSQLDASEISRLQMASQKIYFAPPEQEISNIATSLASESADRKYWEGVLTSLKKGQCIVHGPNLQLDGKLSKSNAVLVNIAPLMERI